MTIVRTFDVWVLWPGWVRDRHISSKAVLPQAWQFSRSRRYRLPQRAHS